MAETIILRWYGPADATSGSRYRVERTLDWTTWTELAAEQAATSPYVSANAALAADAEYGDATLTFDDLTGFSAAGYMWLGMALVQWTSKDGDTLEGCTWHSGYGAYESGTLGYEAHENYTDTGVLPTLGAVVYRVTHIDATDRESPPAYAWWYYPDAPNSGEHCVIVVSIGPDLGLDPQVSVTISCQLATDDQYSRLTGQHLDQATGADQVTNALGLAQFQCWKSAARYGKGGGAASAYSFTLNTTSGPLTVTVAEVPERDWVRLFDVGQ